MQNIRLVYFCKQVQLKFIKYKNLAYLQLFIAYIFNKKINNQIFIHLHSSKTLTIFYRIILEYI